MTFFANFLTGYSFLLLFLSSKSYPRLSLRRLIYVYRCRYYRDCDLNAFIADMVEHVSPQDLLGCYYRSIEGTSNSLKSQRLDIYFAFYVAEKRRQLRATLSPLYSLPEIALIECDSHNRAHPMITALPL